MHTERLSIAAPQAFARGLTLLDAGEVLVAPTDTVYGVMCRFDDAAAIEQLFVVKQRPLEKAIPVLIGEWEQIGRVAELPLPAGALRLIEELWPGALTLVLPARPHLPQALTAGGATVGVRMPDHDWLRRLLVETGPLAATSANLSGHPATASVDEVLVQLSGRVPLLLEDADRSTSRPNHAPAQASTVVDLTVSPPAILRAGAAAEQVRRILSARGLRVTG